MRAVGVRLLDIEIAAYSTGVGLRGMRMASDGSIYFRLQAQRNSWRVRDSRGRLTASVCMHGHWEFFRNVFNEASSARLYTSLTPRPLRSDNYDSIAEEIVRRQESLCGCPYGIEARQAGTNLSCSNCSAERACDDHRLHENDYL